LTKRQAAARGAAAAWRTLLADLVLEHASRVAVFAVGGKAAVGQFLRVPSDMSGVVEGHVEVDKSGKRMVISNTLEGSSVEGNAAAEQGPF
jgi:hypothetical protein